MDSLSELISMVSGSTTASASRYKYVTLQSRYLNMADGTRIAIDVMLPRTTRPKRSAPETPATDRFPTALLMTRYWRSFSLRVPFPPHQPPISGANDEIKYFLARGFAVVTVDARGSGASFGVHPHPWSAQELDDYAQIVTWIRQQPWSNGKVGAFGNSYEGTTAQLVASVAPVEAAIVRQIEFDIYTDVAFPGGIKNVAFMNAWSESNHRQDRNHPATFFPLIARILVNGVRPVDDDKDKAQLRAALTEHEANPDVYPAIKDVVYRNDLYGGNVPMETFSVFAHRAAIEQRNTPIFGWGSWLDGYTADTVIRRFNTFSNPQIAVIGAWTHMGDKHASPYQPPRSPASPPASAQHEMQARFLAQALTDGGVNPANNVLHYYTLGEETWKQTETFPPRGFEPRRWYLQAEQTLGQKLPEQVEGNDVYTVNFDATTGQQNRWYTELVKPVNYGNRADQDAILLTYTSAPLHQDLEITGYPAVMLYVQSTHEDGALYAYLEDVDEQGVVRYLTDGQLRLLHRALAPSAPYWMGGPIHSFKRADGQVMPRGEFVPVTFALLPTSVLIRRGHRLRLAIAGHDADTFARIPDTGTPMLTVARCQSMPSYLELPVRVR